MVAVLLSGCASTFPALGPHSLRAETPAKAEVTSVSVRAVADPSSPEMDALIAKYAAVYKVPEQLIRRVIVRESGYNPRARNGPYWGLMQIRYDTAQGMGYQGPAAGLLDADTNLNYAVKYLSGAYLVGDGDADQAVRNYASGYYYSAKAKGMLDEVGLR
jgi:soluble lytic murein transglycosylase-like protein